MKYGIYCLLFSTLLHGMAQDANSSNSSRRDLYAKIREGIDKARTENAGKPQTPFIVIFPRCKTCIIQESDILELAKKLKAFTDIEQTNTPEFEQEAQDAFKSAFKEITTRNWDNRLTSADKKFLKQVRRIIAMIPITHPTRERSNAHWENYKGARYLLACLKNLDKQDPDVSRQEFEAMAARLAQRKASKTT